jgi:hypothetical protein
VGIGGAHSVVAVDGLTTDLHLRLLLDWRLWVYTPFEVQQTLLEQLYERARIEPEVCVSLSLALPNPFCRV